MYVSSHSGAGTANAFLQVDDIVTAINPPSTSAKFRLDVKRQYIVMRITSKGLINLGGEHDYLASRFFKVGRAERPRPSHAVPSATEERPAPSSPETGAGQASGSPSAAAPVQELLEAVPV